MNWTTEYPTKPGFYWMRSARKGLVRRPENVVEIDDDLCVRFTGSELLSPRAAALDAEWQGPIEPDGEKGVGEK